MTKEKIVMAGRAVTTIALPAFACAAVCTWHIFFFIATFITWYGFIRTGRMLDEITNN